MMTLLEKFMSSFGPKNEPFSPKISYFDQIYPLVKFIHFDLTGIIFPHFWTFFDRFAQILTFDVILPPKITILLPFSLKMSSCEVFDPFNDIWGQYGGPKTCSLSLNKDWGFLDKKVSWPFVWPVEENLPYFRDHVTKFLMTCAFDDSRDLRVWDRCLGILGQNNNFGPNMEIKKKVLGNFS